MVLFFSLLFIALLGNPKLALEYANRGLTTWFSRIVPVLLPFMIVARLLMKMGLPNSFRKLNRFTLKPILMISDEAIYAACIGLLGGFPLGAILTSQLYVEQRISKDEASFLFTFCNMLSPGFFLGVCMPLMNVNKPFAYCFITYGTVLLYAFILRRTVFKNLNSEESKRTTSHLKKTELGHIFGQTISDSVNGILNIGAYMVFFQILMIVPKYFFKVDLKLLSPILEISAGIYQAINYPLYILFCFSFGGFCCAFQTAEYLKICEVPFLFYIKHKTLLAIFTALLYLVFFRLFAI